ncbi:MAG: ribose 5-phosphate isomerase B [Clostridiales bacterium]|nr:ribose 5-phosphate isomerase B [Clostridiales bacterium]
MRISIGSDHGGFALKEHIRDYLIAQGHEVTDVGTYSGESCDYPDFGYAAAKRLALGEADRAIVICSSGVGISITANKVRGVRCALCSEPLSAEMSRRHNDANCLAMGALMIGVNMAERITDVFLSTEFEGGRHSRRVGKIADCEENETERVSER